MPEIGAPGTLVRYREREWVVLPSADSDVLLLRPLAGSNQEVTAVLRPLSNLMAGSLPHERVVPATFPLPEPAEVQDHVAVKLLVEAARLLLRDGAAPFRSLGHLSVRPRPYQFVPLLLALRLDPVRLFIADDVGVGKTIEAALVARELLDRGDVSRIAVICPPYLCDQWQRELAGKFGIEAAVIRAGTISRLERETPPDTSVFEHNRHFVASMDTVKGQAYRASFVRHCPELVIVDEVHGAAEPPQGSNRRQQQQRHELLRQLAADRGRHLVLVSASPHSGVASSFLSLLSLLDPAFGDLPLAHLGKRESQELARHFVQRRRADVAHWLGADTPFPRRDSTGAERPYRFSAAYADLYQQVYEFASVMVQSAESLSGWRRRMRYWSALALLRCVASSPAAAEVALLKRAAGSDDAPHAGAEMSDEDVADLDAELAPTVYDLSEAEAFSDAPPAAVFAAQERDPHFPEADRRRLRRFARMARDLGGPSDNKLALLLEVVGDLLDEGHHPIVWCRYIATADYVAAALQDGLGGRHKTLKVTSVTGALSEDERRLKVAQLAAAPRRVLVATDCLSEGINLQESYTAVVHYDLPWNPNRLEQREGRVDRFGQPAPTVKAVMIFGQDNPVDGAVLDVLLRKAEEIYKQLGIHVPVPIESESIIEAVLTSLFRRSREYHGAQLHLFEAGDDVDGMVRQVHDQWTDAASREEESRTRFAQRAIKPEEVARELDATDSILGGPDEVRRFLRAATGRMGVGLKEGAGGVWQLRPAELPEAVRLRLGATTDVWSMAFESPTPSGVAFVGRNHPLVEGLAEHLLDLGFHPPAGGSPVARSGVVLTRQVTRRTTIALLRLRHLLREHGAPATLAEETLAWGYEGLPPAETALEPDAARKLLDSVRPAGNVPLAEKTLVLSETLAHWQPQDGDGPTAMTAHMDALLAERAALLAASQHRVRPLTGGRRVTIEPQSPPDLLGLVVLLPLAKGLVGE